jgi:hypothetical protein
LVLVRSTDLYEKHLSLDFLAAALSFLLAVLTHHYVEAPLRRYGAGNPYWSSKRILLLGITSTAVICMLSVLMSSSLINFIPKALPCIAETLTAMGHSVRRFEVPRSGVS